MNGAKGKYRSASLFRSSGGDSIAPIDPPPTSLVSKCGVDSEKLTCHSAAYIQ
jgi:hypothetical protein